MNRPRVGIFGGAFNPPHLGHMRLAVEVMEALGPERLDFLPTAVPPHKAGQGLLPFDLRVRMLRGAMGDIPGLAVNMMEEERQGPSYTVDTLRLYHEREPELRPFFILGGEDFVSIRAWYGWRSLPMLADLVIVPRAGSEVDQFIRTVRAGWPEAKLVPAAETPADALFSFPGQEGWGHIMHLPLPRLDIRAELVRERFLEGRSIRFLVPPGVEALILAEEETVSRCWRGMSTGASR